MGRAGSDRVRPIIHEDPRLSTASSHSSTILQYYKVKIGLKKPVPPTRAHSTIRRRMSETRFGQGKAAALHRGGGVVN